MSLHRIRMFDAAIIHTFELDKAVATMLVDGQPVGESEYFQSDAKAHGTDETPSAMMQACHWAKARMKTRLAAEDQAARIERNRLIQEAIDKAKAAANREAIDHAR